MLIKLRGRTFDLDETISFDMDEHNITYDAVTKVITYTEYYTCHCCHHEEEMEADYDISKEIAQGKIYLEL
jgi:hypothetical protein